MIKEINETMMPSRNIRRIGLIENEVIPSTAKLIIFLSGYLLSPAKRSARLYFTVAVFRPMVGTMPRRKRLTSWNLDSSSNARLLMSR